MPTSRRRPAARRGARQAARRRRGVDHLREQFEDKLSGNDCTIDLIGGDTLAGLLPIPIASTPEPVTARKDVGRGGGLAALFWVCAPWHPLSLPVHAPKRRRPRLSGLAIEAKKLEVFTDRILPFVEAKEALAYLETGRAKGKVFLGCVVRHVRLLLGIVAHAEARARTPRQDVYANPAGYSSLFLAVPFSASRHSTVGLQ